MKKSNLILVGMAGAGKSTLGILAAKALGMDFIDSDILIQRREGRLLSEIIAADGIDAFLAIEERVLTELAAENAIIATGGSAVYSEKAMAALAKDGAIVYLSLPYGEIAARVDNIVGRGVVLRAGNTLKDAYDERLPLYERYSDYTIDCAGKDIESCVNALLTIANA